MYCNGVFSVTKITVYSELVTDKGVFALTKLRTVQIILSKTLYTLEYKIYVFSLLGAGKGLFIPPLIILIGFRLKDVIAHKEVLGKITLAGKIKLYTSGDSC